MVPMHFYNQGFPNILKKSTIAMKQQKENHLKYESSASVCTPSKPRRRHMGKKFCKTIQTQVSTNSLRVGCIIRNILCCLVAGSSSSVLLRCPFLLLVNCEKTSVYSVMFGKLCGGTALHSGLSRVSGRAALKAALSQSNRFSEAEKCPFCPDGGQFSPP